MTVPVFVDTNVLIYAVSADQSSREKSAVAVDILRRPDLAMSAQVLQEFYWQVTRQGREHSLSHEHATLLVESMSRYPIHDISFDLVMTALRLTERYQLSYWDAAIVAAARLLGCRELLSEDLSDGQEYDGVTVRNPFAQLDA